MKIALIGATGFVGSAILQEALQRGHEVTAIVRNPEKVKPHPKLRPHKADVQKGDEVTRSVAGHDAVISAFNPGWSNPNMYNLQVKGTRAIIDGVKKAGVKRLLFVGGAGSLEIKPGVQSVDLPEFPAEYKQGALATREALNLLRQRADLGLVLPFSFSRSFPGSANRKIPLGNGSAARGCEGRKPNLGRGLCDGDDRRGGEA